MRKYTKQQLKKLFSNLKNKAITDTMAHMLIDETYNEEPLLRTSGFYAPGAGDSVMTWDDVTRKLLLEPLVPDAGGETIYDVNGDVYVPHFRFYVWERGPVLKRRYAYDAENSELPNPDEIELPNEEGLFAIYYDFNQTNRRYELTYTKTPDLNTIYEIYVDKVVVAWIYWDAVNGEALYVGDSRHGSQFNPHMQWAEHQTLNSQRQSGLKLTDVVYDGDGTLPDDYQFGISAGELWHEDIYAETEAVGTTEGIPVWYFAGGLPRFLTPSLTKFLNTGTGRVAWNDIAGPAEATNNYFVAYHLFATNCTLHPHISVMGQAEHETLGAAVGSIEAEIATLRQELPHSNLMHIASIVLQTSDDYTNTAKARVVWSATNIDTFTTEIEFDENTRTFTLRQNNEKPDLEVTISGEDNVQSDWNQTDNLQDDYIKNKPAIPEDVGDLTDTGDILGDKNVQSDWNQTDNLQDDFIKNKPAIPEDVGDLTDTGDILGDKNVQSDWNQTDNLQDDFIKNKPAIPEDVGDLTDTGDILGDKNVQSDWNQTDNLQDDYIKNKPAIPTNTDEKVKYDSGDPAAGYLSEKIIAEYPILVGEGTEANENKLVISIADLCTLIENCDVIQQLQQDIEDLKNFIGFSFITEWNMPSGDFTLPLGGGTFDMVVDWGDGSPTSTVTASTDVAATHNYSSAGTYQIKITGKCGSWYINNGTVKTYLTKVIQWGKVDFDTLNFYGCSNLNEIPNGTITGVSGLSSFENTFRGCSSLPAIPAKLFDEAINVSSNGFKNTFYQCTGLTGSIPTDLFKFNTLVSTSAFDYTFYQCSGLTGSIPTDLFRYNTLASTRGFMGTFHGCSGLTGTINENLFRYNTLVSTQGFQSTFNLCEGLTGAIPANLFRYNTEVSTSGFLATFGGCSGLTGAIPADLFRYNTLVSSSGFSGTFADCTGLTSIPAGLFDYNTEVSTSGFQATFQNCSGLTGNIPTDLFKYNTLVSSSGFSNTFRDCSGLTGAIPADLFRYNTLVSTWGFNCTFRGCVGLTSIPAGLFDYNTAITDYGFQQTFHGCTGITAIPTDLFKFNTQLAKQGFLETFYGCTGLTSIPTDLFRYNTLVSNSAFSSTFHSCTGLTSIPAGLFDYNTAVSSSGFDSTFFGCTGLTSIPTDLFRYNTAVTTYAFNATFYGCTGLTGIPIDLFRYNTLVSTNGFSYTFSGCINIITIPEDLYDYCPSVTSFYRCHYNNTAVTSNVPDLWNSHSGATGTQCFFNCNNAANYASIPAGWK